MPPRKPLIKAVRQFISLSPPENLAPWKKPNAKMRKIIDTKIRGRLERTIAEVQESIARQYFARLGGAGDSGGGSGDGGRSGDGR
jgi:hypothetical protein